jgi:hypothetical protein
MAGLSSGRFSAKYLMSWLLKPHWAAEMKKDPPTVRQTRSSVVVSVALTHSGVYGQSSRTYN